MEKQRLEPTLVYVLSSIGLVCCCIFGSGIITSTIGFFIANNKLNEAKNDIDNYDYSSVKAMNNAKIFSIVVMVLNILMILRIIYVIATVGWDNIYDEFMRAYQEALEAQQNG